MAVYENKLTRADDFIVFTTRLPFTGVVRVDTFTDIVAGEDQYTYFQREINYSTDGLFFTPWLPLSDSTLQAIVCPKGNLWVNYRYTRKGANTAVALQFSSVELVGVFQAQPCQNAYVLPKSIFKDLFCNNPQHLSMAAHLTKKLFDAGIVPNYLTRNAGDNAPLDDADYLAFWGTVSAFFALIIMFGQQFENIESHPELFREYLLQRGMFFGSQASVTQLNHLRRNQYAVARQRGTLQATAASLPGQTVVSELASLLDNDPTRDEYLVSMLDHTLTGFTVGRSSPLYRGTNNNQGLNKAYESTVDVDDLSKYPLLNKQFIALVPVTLRTGNTYQTMQIKGVGPGLLSGIQYGDPTINPINVDTYTDYEVSFYVLRTTADTTKLRFGIKVFNALDAQLSAKLADSTEAPQNNFSLDLKLRNTLAPYLVRAVVYGARTGLTQRLSNLTVDPTATNLLLPEGACKIVPTLLVDNLNGTVAGGEVYIWNLQVRPLKTGYSLGFVQSGPIVQAWLKNRNIGLSAFDLETTLRDTLLPYDTNLRITPLYDVYRPAYVGKFRAESISHDCDNADNNDGTITLKVLGGIEPYKYHWTYGQTTPGLTGLVPGSYDVTITDAQSPPQQVQLHNIEVLAYTRKKGWRAKQNTAYCVGH